MPPADLPSTVPAAERAVAGCILREPEWASDAAAGLLRPADFLGHVERLVFEAAQALAAAGVRPELAAVYTRLTADGHTDCVGPFPGGLAGWLTTAWENQPTAANLEYFAGLVREAADARALVATAEELRRDASDRIEPPADTAARFADRLADLAAGRGGRSEATAGEAAAAGLAEALRRHTPDDKRDRVGWGFAGLDRLMPSLDPGQLVLVGARTSVGKTTLALNVALAAAERGLPVYFVSLEMGRAEIGEKLLLVPGGVNGAMVRAGQASPAELDAMAATAAALRGLPLTVNDGPARPVEEIEAAARRHQRRYGLSLVVVDYLQLVLPTDRRASRREQVEHVSRSLKQMARALGVPVLALVQLNRELENRADAAPRLSDIREAGGLEQDADAVVLLSRAAGPAGEAVDGRVVADLAKHRGGPTGRVELVFRRGSSRFEDVSPV